jgi:hypothetical protein
MPLEQANLTLSFFYDGGNRVENITYVSTHEQMVSLIGFFF